MLVPVFRKANPRSRVLGTEPDQFRSVLNVVVEAGHADSEPIRHRLHCQVAQPKLTRRLGDEVSVDDRGAPETCGLSASSDFSTGSPARLDLVADIRSIVPRDPFLPGFSLGVTGNPTIDCLDCFSKLLRKLSDPGDRGAILPGIGGCAVRVRCRSAVVACGAAALLATLPLMAPDAGASGSTTGVTPSTINIAYIYNDLSILTQEHLAPRTATCSGTCKIRRLPERSWGAWWAQDQPDIVQDAELDRFRGERRCGLSDSDRTGPRLHRVYRRRGRWVSRSMHSCGAQDLTFLAGSAPPQYFDQAQGRLFTIQSDSAMDGDRQYAVGPM